MFGTYVLVACLFTPALAAFRRGAPSVVATNIAPESFFAFGKANVTEAEMQKFLDEQKRGASMASKVPLPPKSLADASSKVAQSVFVAKEANATNASSPAQKGASFQGWYASHTSGRGIWKWNNALEAYQRHFSGLYGSPVKMAEVGVQSGGSILMWEAVVGEKCHVYGLDINPACTKFTNGQTTISIGDQADPAMWKNFFEKTVNKGELDILVDDGGHEPHQMLTTLAEVFYRLQPGGFIALEDIHGQHYVPQFFAPTANYLGYMAEKGDVESVHVYPYLLVVHKGGKSRLPKSELQHPANPPVVSGFSELWEAMHKNYGGSVVLENKDWGTFHTAQGLNNFFAHFGELHAYSYYATPTGCEHTAAAVCVNTINPSPTQTLINGIHIYKDRMVAEVNAAPPVINADRKGTEWIQYGL